MNRSGIVQYIVNWLNDYSNQSKTQGFIVGISGGVDSAVTSTLCAMAGKRVMCITLPIHQHNAEYLRGQEHLTWLSKQFSNVEVLEINLSESFEQLRKSLPKPVADHWLSMANTRARLRMSTLYAIGQANGLLVAGTGNKIEDFGVGFFTKYGDGGVDVSPIADLTKTQVFSLAQELKIVESIQKAKPTDGLWADSRSDEEQLGASYPELEWAMEFANKHAEEKNFSVDIDEKKLVDLTIRQREVVAIYLKFHNANRHKMHAIPVCKIPHELI